MSEELDYLAMQILGMTNPKMHITAEKKIDELIKLAKQVVVDEILAFQFNIKNKHDDNNYNVVLVEHIEKYFKVKEKNNEK